MPYADINDRRRANRESYQRHKEERLARGREWKMKNAEKIREAGWYTSDESKAKRRDNYRRPAGITRHKHYRAHGLSAEEFEFLEKLQGTRCAGCREVFRSTSKIHIDHDHSCHPNTHASCGGACVRGLLCGPCNMALGSYEKIRSWADGYLKNGESSWTPSASSVSKLKKAIGG